ncbi:hypothetical protein HUT16_07005 [Kitasatospora sp. NA04385]|uniref:hypothetical protein n=1 Tax=Kitasatospora sp. NA04385 TaxID=2742135 RepID=UPI00159076F4|nr:hypothetical protein [Kitasatospora sp. NA04385]QKW18850.1 hypothetical protein HUT16_07005 [Kitasatospora sp. NA04385]
MLYTGQPLVAVDVLQRFLRGGFADCEQASDSLERAFLAARLDPPPGLSPVYRDDVPPESAGLALGCAGLPWAQRLAEALVELAVLRGEFTAAVRVASPSELGPEARSALGAAS